jgi:hypothetical protein
MSQYRSAYRTEPPRATRLKSLATKIAAAALMITGSAGIAVAATSSPAAASASASASAGAAGGAPMPYC